MPDRALITGITGFVGRHLCQHLLECGDDVIGTAESLPAESPSWGRLPSRDRILLWDLANPAEPPDQLVTILRGFRPNVVYHLAAISIPEQCGLEVPTEHAWQVNVEGTRRVLQLLKRLPEQPKLLFVSTSHVYQVPQDRVTFVDEHYPVQPRNAYAKTKREAEALILQAVKEWALPAVIVRAFPHTGPGQSKKMMLPSWAAQFARKANTVIVHTLQAIIDICDVRDVVRAYRLLAGAGSLGEVYHVGSGIARTSGEVFNILRELAGEPTKVLETRPGVKYDPIAVIDKIRLTTGWQPEFSIETTVDHTYRWWQDNLQLRQNNDS